MLQDGSPGKRELDHRWKNAHAAGGIDIADLAHRSSPTGFGPTPALTMPTGRKSIRLVGNEPCDERRPSDCENHRAGMHVTVKICNAVAARDPVMYKSSSDSLFKEALADALEVGKREIAELASVVDGAAAMYGEAGAKLVRDGDLMP